MHKLGFLDAAFLYAETPSAPMNIASLQLLELPSYTDAAAYFESLKPYVAARLGPIPFMTQRLKATPFMLDQPVWVSAPDFDIDRHVKRVTLPSPGSARQLEKMVARLHETPFDRSHPLWSFHLIDGLDPQVFGAGVVGWYCKYHHACIDGMAGQGIIEMLFSESLDQLPPEREPPKPEREPSLLDLLFDAGKNAFGRSVSLAGQSKQRWDALVQLSKRMMEGAEGLGAFAEPAPNTPFNVAVGPYRSWAMASLPLNDVRAVAKSRHASLNDAVMAVCAAGLRTYLLRREALPERPLIAGVPVSLRKPGDTAMCNRVSMLLASLATDTADPLMQLDQIKRSTRVGKTLLMETRALQVEDVHVPGLPYWISNAAYAMERLKLADMVPAGPNVVISNVMGPLRTKYLNRARMLSHFPVSIPAHGAAVNLTVQSYVDRIDLGVTGCLDALPDPQALRDDIVAGWHALRDACRAAGAELTESPTSSDIAPRAAA